MNWKKYLLPSGLILALALGVAFAQSITRSVQLSQDPSGPIGIDTSNNIYLPAHVLQTSRPAPTLTSCGTGSPAILGTDVAGLVTMGTAATGCVITFRTAYLATPWCVVTSQSPILSPVNYTAATTALTLTASANGLLVNYWCSGST